MTVNMHKKLTVAGLFAVPLAALTVACGPVQSQSSSPPSSHPASARMSTPVHTSTPPARLKPPVTTHPVTHPATHPAPPRAARPMTPVPRVTGNGNRTAGSGFQCHFRVDAAGYILPDPVCTPGAVLTTSTASVCSPGWASSHRRYFTKAEREAAFWKYGVGTTNPAGYGEYDHLIPLELGGSNSPSNLWPEQGSIPNAKDAIEDALHKAVCSGHASLAAAQQAIAQDWPTAGTKVIEVGSGLK